MMLIHTGPRGVRGMLRDFILLFLQGSLYPQNYELAPQIPEKNYQCSAAP